MGRRRLNDVLREYIKLEEIFGDKVYLFIDNVNRTPSELEEHKHAFLKHVNNIVYFF